MYAAKTMERSISMPVKPRDDDQPKLLKRSNETEKLYSTGDEIEIDNLENDDEDDDHFDVNHHNFNLHSTTDDEDDDCSENNQNNSDQLTALKDYVRDNRRRRSTWYGSSTIEIQNKDDQFDDDDESKVKENDYNPARRLIAKNGYQNVTFKKIPKRSVRYFKDLVTTLIEQNWCYTVVLFTATFFISWLIFACLWYLIAQAHGDLDFDQINGKRLNDGKQPCVVGAKDLTGMFIHSLELQTTIGFGEKYPTEECPEGVFLFVMQIIISIGIEGAMVAVVYAKMAKPIKQYSKLTFSKTACVHLRDGKLCLVFRVCDPREQKSICTKIRVYVVMDIKTTEGETMKIHKELVIDGNGTGLIMWPETICHVIDKMSPFYEFTEKDFYHQNYEIFVSLVGHSPTTGQQTESRTSYLSREISWGQRFMNLILYNHEKGIYMIDYDNFHTTFPVTTAVKSAQHLRTRS